MKLFKKLDQYLLLNHPLLWSIQLHRLLLWWIPTMALLIGLFSINDVADFESHTSGLIGTWLTLVMIAFVILWLIYLLRFNVFKQFGKRPFLDELQNFFYIFTGMLLISLVSHSYNITRFVKIRSIYPKSTIAHVVSSAEMIARFRNERLTQEYSVCRTDYATDSAYKIQLIEYRKIAKSERAYNGCVIFLVPVNRMENYDNYYTTSVYKRLGIDETALNKNYEAIRAKGDSMLFYKAFCEAISKVDNFPYSPEMLAKDAEFFYFDFTGTQGAGFAGIERTREEYRISERISSTVSNSIRYGYSSDSGFLEDWVIRLIFYFAFFGTLLLLIFRNMTLKTFLVSLGVGALMPLVISITMLVMGGFDGDRLQGVMLFFYILFGFISMLIIQARTRNIFHGIALNLFTISTPLVGLLLVSLYHPRGDYDSYLERENIMFYTEIIEIVVFLILLQPVFKSLYTRWYSLPEQ